MWSRWRCYSPHPARRCRQNVQFGNIVQVPLDALLKELNCRQQRPCSEKETSLSAQQLGKAPEPLCTLCVLVKASLRGVGSSEGLTSHHTCMQRPHFMLCIPTKTSMHARFACHVSLFICKEQL